MIKIKKEVLNKVNKSEFCFDVIVLGVLWGIVLFAPADILQYQGIGLIDILKIVVLISSLELIGFFAHLFLGERAGILLQGFLGGFVSSTMTFVRFTQNEVESQLHSMTVSRALLLSTMGMLVECILIVFAIVPNYALLLAIPFLTQMIVLILIVIFLGRFHHAQKTTLIKQELVIEEPIIWKKVGRFAVLILGLIYLLRILSTVLKLPFEWTTLLLSLFEAHGVLTAALTEYKNSGIDDLYRVILIILIGNILSKSFLVLKGKNKKIRVVVISSLVLSFCISFAVMLKLPH